ncbi:MAG TPA: glycoside hydrolase family 3 N-terminal domain-containing protein [Chryseosolibacter sp.]
MMHERIRQRKVIVLVALLLATISAQAQMYKDARLTDAERTRDLIGRMTLEEKLGQLLCPLGWGMYSRDGDSVTHSPDFEQLVKDSGVGMLWATYRADPWTKKTLANGLNPELAAKAGNAIQKFVLENTRLGIPVFLAEESPHGHMAIGTTVFPTGIGLASSWSPSLLNEVGSVIAKEIRLQGAHIGYGPVLDLSRDSRWSRTEETFGEDPILSATLGAAIVRGAGGGRVDQKYSVISTLKHFVAYGVPEGGHNGNATSIGPRDLQESFFPPFRRAIKAGALSVMTSYNSIDGIPTTANPWLLRTVLRDEWKFRGFVVSDLGSIEGVSRNHHVAENVSSAAVAAMTAGVDADLGGEAFTNLIDAVRAGELSESVVDTAVSRILRLKFEMGLFENPYVDPQKAKESVRTQKHIDLARRAAQQSIVLLRNKDAILPLSRKIRKIAVIGPNADNVYNMLGDYTAPQEEGNVVTVLEGIRAKAGNARVEYVKGCSIRDTADADIRRAVRAARGADVAVLVVGGSSARDFRTTYIETGAAVTSATHISDMESGEGYDRATLTLLGKQLELLKAVKETGKPLIVIYIQGRPLNMNWAAEHADALLTAWYPGQEGGNAIADVLFGDYNPAGRLPISIPRHEGQLPVYYNKRNPTGHDYVEMSATPLYPFGFGLSFSKFEYSALEVARKGKHEFEVSFTVRNAGVFDGDEVAQLYLRDEVASTVRPQKQLRHFERLFLRKGEIKTFTFLISAEDLSLINRDMEHVVEPGTFVLMIGASSDDVRLSTKIVVD